MRAHFEDFRSVDFAPRPGRTWADALEEHADALSRNPWTEQFPVQLRDANVGVQDGRWYAIDAEGYGMPLRMQEEERVRLLALSGNAPSELFGEFDGHELRLLSAWRDWGFFS
jgi:hypothetical protein